MLEDLRYASEIIVAYSIYIIHWSKLNGCVWIPINVLNTLTLSSDGHRSKFIPFNTLFYLVSQLFE